MVDSAGSRRRISRRTVRPPTPESNTPIGRGSDTPSVSHRSGNRASHDDLGAPLHVPADGGIRTGYDKWHAFVVGLDHQTSIRDDFEVRPATQRPRQLVPADADA